MVKSQKVLYWTEANFFDKSTVWYCFIFLMPMIKNKLTAVDTVTERTQQHYLMLKNKSII
jgi:hypothetical protein